MLVEGMQDMMGWRILTVLGWGSRPFRNLPGHRVQTQSVEGRDGHQHQVRGPRAYLDPARSCQRQREMLAARGEVAEMLPPPRECIQSSR